MTLKQSDKIRKRLRMLIDQYQEAITTEELSFALVKGRVGTQKRNKLLQKYDDAKKHRVECKKRLFKFIGQHLYFFHVTQHVHLVIF